MVIEAIMDIKAMLGTVGLSGLEKTTFILELVWTSLDGQY
mgnify:CR=1 FL=1